MLPPPYRRSREIATHKVNGLAIIEFCRGPHEYQTALRSNER